MNILLVCSGGMSSAIVVKAIQTAAAKKNMTLNVKSVGASELGAELKTGWDAVLVAPQVRHRLAAFEAEAAEYDTPVALIPPQGYSPLGGALVLEQIEKLARRRES